MDSLWIARSAALHGGWFSAGAVPVSRAALTALAAFERQMMALPPRVAALWTWASGGATFSPTANAARAQFDI
jgi:hypothetical protein